MCTFFLDDVIPAFPKNQTVTHLNNHTKTDENLLYYDWRICVKEYFEWQSSQSKLSGTFVCIISNMKKSKDLTLKTERKRSNSKFCSVILRQ